MTMTEHDTDFTRYDQEVDSHTYPPAIGDLEQFVDNVDTFTADQNEQQSEFIAQAEQIRLTHAARLEELQRQRDALSASIKDLQELVRKKTAIDDSIAALRVRMDDLQTRQQEVMDEITQTADIVPEVETMGQQEQIAAQREEKLREELLRAPPSDEMRRELDDHYAYGGSGSFSKMGEANYVTVKKRLEVKLYDLSLETATLRREVDEATRVLSEQQSRAVELQDRYNEGLRIASQQKAELDDQAGRIMANPLPDRFLTSAQFTSEIHSSLQRSVNGTGNGVA